MAISRYPASIVLSLGDGIFKISLPIFITLSFSSEFIFLGCSECLILQPEMRALMFFLICIPLECPPNFVPCAHLWPPLHCLTVSGVRGGHVVLCAYCLQLLRKTGHHRKIQCGGVEETFCGGVEIPQPVDFFGEKKIEPQAWKFSGHIRGGAVWSSLKPFRGRSLLLPSWWATPPPFFQEYQFWGAKFFLTECHVVGGSPTPSP